MKIKKGEHEKLIKAYFEGARAALEIFSHLHNGVQYVSFGKTLQEAIDEINAEEKLALTTVKENPEILK